jgi:hypothetical protein
MGNEYSFKYRIYCELIVVSQNSTPGFISEMIQIKPSRSFSKGETFRAKKSGTAGKRMHNLWAIKSQTIITEEENISSHIEYFKDLLKNKLGIIKRIKSDPESEISFWIWIETDGIGVSFDIPENDLAFIRKISNRLQVSIVSNSK